jgi:hypothetical protein
MIDRKFTTTAEVRRTTWVTEEIEGVTVDKSAEVIVDTINGYLQSATAEYAQYNGLTMGKGYTFWCPLNTTTGEGDTLVIDGNYYSVRAVRRLSDGHNPHTQIALEQIGETEHGS